MSLNIQSHPVTDEEKLDRTKVVISLKSFTGRLKTYIGIATGVVVGFTGLSAYLGITGGLSLLGCIVLLCCGSIFSLFVLYACVSGKLIDNVISRACTRFMTPGAYHA